jgi:hypothetical protein
VTNALKEGGNTINFRAVNGSFNSPWASIYMIYDLKPPTSTSATPTSTSGVVQYGGSGAVSGLKTLSPYISLALSDPGYSTTTTSGVDSAVTAMYYSTASGTTSVFVKGSTVATSWNSGTGMLVAVSTAGTPIKLSSANASGTAITYTVGVEFGDFAGYRSSTTWTFVLAPVVSASTPVVTIITPANGASTGATPLIEAQLYDGNSDINPFSIVLQVTQLGTVCSNALGNLSSCWNPATGILSYTPTTALTGTQTVTLNVQNWAGVSNAVQTWQFTP